MTCIKTDVAVGSKKVLKEAVRFDIDVFS